MRHRARWTAVDWWLLAAVAFVVGFNVLIILAILSTKGAP